MGCGQTDQKLEERRNKNEEESKQIISDFMTKYKHNIKLNEKEFHQKFIETMGYDVNLIGYLIYEEMCNKGKSS